MQLRGIEGRSFVSFIVQSTLRVGVKQTGLEPENMYLRL